MASITQRGYRMQLLPWPKEGIRQSKHTQLGRIKQVCCHNFQHEFSSGVARILYKGCRNLKKKLKRSKGIQTQDLPLQGPSKLQHPTKQATLTFCSIYTSNNMYSFLTFVQKFTNIFFSPKSWGVNWHPLAPMSLHPWFSILLRVQLHHLYLYIYDIVDVTKFKLAAINSSFLLFWGQITKLIWIQHHIAYGTHW